MNTIQANLEAILFAAGEPVEIKSLAAHFKKDSKEISREIEQLEEFYRERNRGLQLMRKANTIQLVSSAEHGKSVARFLNKKLQEPLSNAALEVLAVIAYRGPVTRAQIEHIRGVNCSFTLRNLAIRGIVERKENPADSRSYLYEVSFDFLRNCGLYSVEELPDYENLHNHKIAQIPSENPENILKINKAKVNDEEL